MILPVPTGDRVDRIRPTGLRDHDRAVQDRMRAQGSPFRTGPIRTLTDLENSTSAWVAWYNERRLMHRLRRRPPAEAEAEY